MLGTSFGSSAKGTGLKALEFALSMCDSVDMYGFTVDPGYKEWYFKKNLILKILQRKIYSHGSSWWWRTKFKFYTFSFRTRYFSESRGGHTPLLGRAYYQMMECLGVSILL